MEVPAGDTAAEGWSLVKSGTGDDGRELGLDLPRDLRIDHWGFSGLGFRRDFRCVRIAREIVEICPNRGFVANLKETFKKTRRT